MKSATFDRIHNDATLPGDASGNSVWIAFKQFVEAVRQARAEHDMRNDLACLDDTVLRDIGIGADEIPRVQAREDFTPRAWQ